MDIKAGDLVWIAKPAPCGCTGGLGCVFVVSCVERVTREGMCIFCGASVPKGEMGAWSGDYYVHLSRLKKIPPLTEPEDRREEMTAMPSQSLPATPRSTKRST
jgi:hypothetical protein